MIEKVYKPSQVELKTIETLVDADAIMINHMILPSGEGLPEHTTNAHLNLIILRGRMTLQLEREETRQYDKGLILEVPLNTKMNLNNFDNETLEFYVVKTPNPKMLNR